MKLKDIFPRWALREPQRDGDLDWPGGGSSFAHLTEGSDWVTVDANNDSPLNGFAVVGGTGTADDPLSDDYTDVNPGSVTIARAAAQRALALKSKTDAQPSITFDTDGSLHWGDGTAAPDTTLERLDGATLALTGGGQAPDLVIGGSSADVESYWNGDGTGVVTDFGSANIYLQQSDAEQVVFGVHVSGEAQNRYRQKSDGSLHWGDGTAAPDTKLRRAAPHTLVVVGEDNAGVWPGLVFSGLGQVGINAHAADTEVLNQYDIDGEGNFAVFSTNGDGSLHWGDGTAAPDVSLRRSAEGALAMYGVNIYTSPDGNENSGAQIKSEGSMSLWNDGGGTLTVIAPGPKLLGIVGDGGGVQLLSPNGTAYNITVSDAGVVTAVAA